MLFSLCPHCYVANNSCRSLLPPVFASHPPVPFTTPPVPPPPSQPFVSVPYTARDCLYPHTLGCCVIPSYMFSYHTPPQKKEKTPSHAFALAAEPESERESERERERKNYGVMQRGTNHCANSSRRARCWLSVYLPMCVSAVLYRPVPLPIKRPLLLFSSATQQAPLSSPLLSPRFPLSHHLPPPPVLSRARVTDL